MNALEVRGLSKQYPRFLLDGVSFCVPQNKICGLIGANGAGKSTTLKAIAGLIAAEGEVHIFGQEAHSQRAKELLGFAGGGFRFYPQGKIGALSHVVSRFYREWDQKRFERLCASFGLDESKRVRECSEGMKVKLSIALALSHGARLLVLDEPTSGLDPFSREELCDILLGLAEEEGVSVLFSTHITADLERTCDRVIYLSEGRMLIDEPLGELLARYRIALFEEEAEGLRAGAVGLKRSKEGWEGLVTGEGRAASLDEIMVHLEWQRREG